MTDPHEIIITPKDTNEPRIAQFSELYALKDGLRTIMYLWNHNSYVVDAVDRTFIINGGRKTKYATMGDCRVVYRRRNQIEYTTNQSDDDGPVRSVNWLLGLQETGGDLVVFVQISEDGRSWKWGNKL